MLCYWTALANSLAEGDSLMSESGKNKKMIFAQFGLTQKYPAGVSVAL